MKCCGGGEPVLLTFFLNRRDQLFRKELQRSAEHQSSCLLGATSNSHGVMKGPGDQRLQQPAVSPRTGLDSVG